MFIKKLYGTALEFEVEKALKQLQREGKELTYRNVRDLLSVYTERQAIANFRTRLYRAFDNLVTEGTLNKAYQPGEHQISHYIFSFNNQEDDTRRTISTS